MIILKLATNGLDLIKLETSLVTSDNKKSVSLEVTFDDSWTGYGKSATFKSSSSDKIYEVPLADNACVVPWEVLESVGTMSVGVRGVKNDGSVIASDLVDYKIAQGAKTGDGTSEDPTPTVYEQLLSNYGSVDQKITKEIQERANAITTEKSERMTEVDVERKRIDNIIKLPSGSTSGDAELIDIRIGVDGTTYNSAGTAVREQVSQLSESIDEIDSRFLTGTNKYNPRSITTQCYFNGIGQAITGDSAGNYDTTDYIKKDDAEVFYSVLRDTLSSTIFVCQYDVNYNWLNRLVLANTTYNVDADTNRLYTSATLRDDCAYVRVCYERNKATDVQIQFSELTKYEEYKMYVNDWTYYKVLELLNKGIDYSKFTLPYIKGGRVICNGDMKTAYYAGVDCGRKINGVWCNFIFEEQKEYDGNATIIINPNGVDAIQNITDLSLHCQIFPSRIKLDVLGGKFGEDKYYLQTLIDTEMETPLLCDGITENTVILSVSEASNNVYLTINGTQYTGKFVPTSEISSISEVIGQYVTIEHFCTTKRKNTTMPMFTFLQARDTNNIYVLRDYFDRQDGILQTAPTGQMYHLLNNSNYRR